MSDINSTIHNHIEMAIFFFMDIFGYPMLLSIRHSLILWITFLTLFIGNKSLGPHSDFSLSGSGGQFYSFFAISPVIFPLK